MAIPEEKVSMPSCVESRTARYIEKSWDVEVCAFPEDISVVSRLLKLKRLGQRLDPTISVVETTRTVSIKQRFIKQYKLIDGGNSLER